MKAHGEELVYVQTADGLTLEGAVIRPVGRPALPIALVFVHGLTGKFYSPSMVRIGRELAAMGYTFITGNNRGHDAGFPFRSRPEDPPRMYGGSWELLSEAPRDIEAWLDFAASLGFGGVGLMGHSLGARKVVAYQGERNDERVRGLVAASPPIRSVRPRLDLLELAERMVGEGRGQDLLPWGISQAGATTTSAEAYLDRYRGPWDLFGMEEPEPAVSRIRCPLLAIYGTNEPTVGGADELALIRGNTRSSARVETELFEGADHSYAGHHEPIARRVAAFLETLV